MTISRLSPSNLAFRSTLFAFWVETGTGQNGFSFLGELGNLRLFHSSVCAVRISQAAIGSATVCCGMTERPTSSAPGTWNQCHKMEKVNNDSDVMMMS